MLRFTFLQMFTLWRVPSHFISYCLLYCFTITPTTSVFFCYLYNFFFLFWCKKRRKKRENRGDI
uniref:Uncharacterized protein n=1 Tax=Rhizophora mucronata TaxID=61149 RepID=A0A2P2NAR7_RHIMU